MSRYGYKKDEVSCAEWEAHVMGRQMVRPRPDVYFSSNALAWELDDGSVVGYTVNETGGCSTCGPDYESVYYLRKSIYQPT